MPPHPGLLLGISQPAISHSVVSVPGVWPARRRTLSKLPQPVAEVLLLPLQLPQAPLAVSRPAVPRLPRVVREFRAGPTVRATARPALRLFRERASSHRSTSTTTPTAGLRFRAARARPRATRATATATSCA